MLDQIFTYFCQFVEAVLCLVATYVACDCVIPWMKSYMDNKTVEKAVKAAEQIYKESGAGAKKYEYVVKMLTVIGLRTDKNSKYWDMLIEAAVKSLDKFEGEVEKEIEKEN